MASAPFKRRKLRHGSEEEALARLSGLLQGNIPLELQISADSAVLAHGDITIAVPQALYERCRVLHSAPAGLLREVVDLFSLWLENEWQRLLRKGGDARETTPAVQPQQGAVEQTFELFEACNFLQDESGLMEYSRRVYALLLTAPLAIELSDVDRVHLTDRDLILPYRLLADLPRDLRHRVLEHGPLAVLDRLPIGSALTCEACEAHNRRKNGPVRWRADAMVLWDWRSALAHHAATPLRVSASCQQWRQNIRNSSRGLHVHELIKWGEACPLHEMPDNLHALDLCSSTPPEGWRSMSLPPTLTRLVFRPAGRVRPPSRPIRFSLLQLPPSLQHLEAVVDRGDLSDVALPTALTTLRLAPNKCVDDPDVKVSALHLPPGLQELEIGYDLRASGLPKLPASLTRLHLAKSGLGPDAVRSLQSATALRELTLSDLQLEAGSLAGARLPAALTKLSLSGAQAGNCGVELPAGLLHLSLPGLHLDGDAPETFQVADLPSRLQHLDLSSALIGDSKWLCSGTPLPAGLTCLRLDDAHLGRRDTLKDVPWPPRLRKLSIDSPRDSRGLGGFAGTPLVLLCGLPDSITELNIDGTMSAVGGLAQHAVLSDYQLLQELFAAVRGDDAPAPSLDAATIALPRALTALSMSGVRFLGDHRLFADLQWPPALQRLSLDDSTFGAVADPRHVQLPQTITMLGLQGNSFDLTGSQPLRLPEGLQELRLERARFGVGGLQSIVLPPGLRALALTYADMGPCGYEGVQLSSTLEVLQLQCSLPDVAPGADPLPWVPWPPSLKSLLLCSPTYGDLRHVCCGLRHVDTLQRLMVVVELDDDDDDDDDRDTRVYTEFDVRSWLSDTEAVPPVRVTLRHVADPEVSPSWDGSLLDVLGDEVTG